MFFFLGKFVACRFFICFFFYDEKEMGIITKIMLRYAGKFENWVTLR